MFGRALRVSSAMPMRLLIVCSRPCAAATGSQSRGVLAKNQAVRCASAFASDPPPPAPGMSEEALAALALCQKAIGLVEAEGAGAAAVREAIGMFSEAAAAGDAEAQFFLGLAHDGLLPGDVIERNAEAAYRCYRRAAEAGCVPAMYNVAMAYQVGFGVRERDRETV